jgi:hypothetical protein
VIARNFCSRMFSSDLWVAKDILNSKDTGVPGAVSYAIGEVKGNLHLAQFEFAGYEIPSQVYSKCPSFTINCVISALI